MLPVLRLLPYMVQHGCTKAENFYLIWNEKFTSGFPNEKIKEYFSLIKGNGLNIYFEEKTFFNEKKKKRTFSTTLNGM